MFKAPAIVPPDRNNFVPAYCLFAASVAAVGSVRLVIFVLDR